MDTALANCQFAILALLSILVSVQAPEDWLFGRDMILDIPLVEDWNLICTHRQQLIDNRLLAANHKRFSHDYNIGDEVLKIIYNPHKLEQRATGPYRVQQVHTNGTLTIRLNDHVNKRISIRRIKPFK